MPVKDEIWVIDDSSILSVEDGKPKKARRAQAAGGARASSRPSPEGAPAVELAAPRAASRPGSSRPLVAAFLSLLVCGAGQAFNGQRKLGALFLLVETSAVVFHWSAVATWGFLMEMAELFQVSESSVLLTVAGLDAFLVLFVLANVAQAWHYASAVEGFQFQGFGKPLVSGLASGLIPGVGQLCNGQLGKALAIMGCFMAGGAAAVSLRLEPFAGFFTRIDLVRRLNPEATQIAAGAIFVAAALWAFSLYDAVVVARYTRGSR